MANYESVLIARQDLGTSQVNNIVSELSDVIKKEGGEVVKVDNWGLKNLAYRIKKNRKGHYVLLNITAPANAIAEYERRHYPLHDRQSRRVQRTCLFRRQRSGCRRIGET